MLQRLAATNAPRATLLIRLLVGAVFLSEGIQKFLFPGSVGAGRFERIGLPAHEFLGPFVGGFELVCGALILLGLFTRIAAIPLIIIMIMAIVSTKIPILLGHGFWGFNLRELSHYGFWSMAHEMRNDWSMLLGAIFLLIVGAGRVSLDHCIASRPLKQIETEKGNGSKA